MPTKTPNKKITADNKSIYHRFEIEGRRDERNSTDEKSIYTDVVMLTERTTANGWITLISGLNIPKKNRLNIQLPLFYNHNKYDKVPIGGAYNIKKTTVTVEGETVKAIVGDFEIRRDNDEAIRVDNSIINGYTKGVSIGAHAIKYEVEDIIDDEGKYIDSILRVAEADLYELSVVYDPADDAALIKAMREEYKASKEPEDKPDETSTEETIQEELDKVEDEIEEADEEAEEAEDEMSAVKELTKEQKNVIARKVAKQIGNVAYKSALKALK